MSNYMVTNTELASVANAIRSKGGTSAQLEWPTGFVSAVQAISSGGGVNPNILKNCLFRPIPSYNYNPSSISSPWSATSNTSYRLVSEGLQVKQSSSNEANIYQQVTIPTQVSSNSEKLTLSALTDVGLFTETVSLPSSGSSYERLISLVISSNPDLRVVFNRDSQTRFAVCVLSTAPSSTSWDDLPIIKGVKLELGEAQSLAGFSGGTWNLLEEENMYVFESYFR